ncbi:choice-of-anchor Q domain-containing protein [Chloroflexota bacterium]
MTGGRVEGESSLPHNTGGGILNHGDLKLTQVTVCDNYAQYYGGGIINYAENSEPNIAPEANLSLESSTVSANAANDGGGICNWAITASFRDATATVTATNSTISGNEASNSGGAITNRGQNQGGGTSDGLADAQMDLINCTVTNNDCADPGSAGGIYTSATDWGPPANGSVSLNNTIVADQAGGLDGKVAGDGVITSNGYNMDSDGSCSLTEATDISHGNANLGPLQDNGGTTFTHALLIPSDAIDAGDCNGSTITTDQRGEPRPMDGDGNGSYLCDIGAYEAPVPPPSQYEQGYQDGYRDGYQAGLKDCPSGKTVGGNIRSVNKIGLIAPWIVVAVLAMVIFAAGIFLMRRRAHG